MERGYQTPNLVVCIRWTADYSPTLCMIWTLTCWYAEKFKIWDGLMQTHGTKFSRQRWWRGAGRHQNLEVCIRRTADYSPSLCLSCMILGTGLLIMSWNSKSCMDLCTLMKQSLADRCDREELSTPYLEVSIWWTTSYSLPQCATVAQRGHFHSILGWRFPL